MHTPRRTRLTRTLLTALASLSLASATHAVTPGQFSQTTEADFADGDAYGTVVTNLGDIKLSSETLPIEGVPDEVTIIHDVAKVGAQTYVAAGPEAKLLKLTDDGVELVKAYEDEQVFSIAAHGDELMIAVSVPGGSRIEVLDDGEIETLVELGEVSYIWDMVWVKEKDDDALLIATGLEGKLYRLEQGEDEAEVLLETPQTNILSVIGDGKGNIYVGTDTDGLIYRIDAEGNPFVVYDAPEQEVSTLAVGEDGYIYAGTAAAEQAKPGRIEQPVKEEEGRLELEPADPAPADPGPKPEPLAEDAPALPAAEGDAPADVQPAPEGEAPADNGGAQDPADADGVDAEADAGEADSAPATPTTEQYDALRAELRDRLQAARENGQFDAAAAPVNPGAGPARPSRAKPASPQQAKKGNAIYRIAPDGFVTEVFRESVTVLAIVPQDGKLIVATGDEGQVYAIDPELNETTVLADLDSKRVTCAAQGDDGLLLGAANPGALILMASAVAEQGGYTSKVLDAGQVSMFGTFKLTADIPEDTTVAIELRSGNVGDPEQAAWSKWTPAKLIKHDADANPLQPREIKLDVPPARYLQYRLTLTGDGDATPVIDQADLAYVAPNTAPTIAKLQVKAPDPGEPGSDPKPEFAIQWQANDGNADRLLYTIEYKPGKADKYLPLAEDLTTNKYAWQTRHVPDGWYTVRVTAHDKLDNPPDSAKSGGRVSEPVLIDNTAPDLEGLKATVKDGKVTLTAKATDQLSAIASVAYSIDGSEQYQASLPGDLIYDSTSEPWGVTISDLSPGGHVIAIRAIDARGNTAYKQLIVTVE